MYKEVIPIEPTPKTEDIRQYSPPPKEVDEDSVYIKSALLTLIDEIKQLVNTSKRKYKRAKNRYKEYKQEKAQQNAVNATEKTNSWLEKIFKKKDKLVEEESSKSNLIAKLLKLPSLLKLIPLFKPLKLFFKLLSPFLGRFKGLVKVIALAGGLLAGAMSGGSLGELTKKFLVGFSNIVKDLSGGLINLWTKEDIDAFFSKARTLFSNGLSGLFETLPSGMQDFLLSTKELVLNTMRGAFNLLPKSVQKVFTNLSEEMSNIFSMTLVEFSDYITKGFSSIIDKARKAFDRFIDNRKSMSELMQEKGKERVVIMRVKKDIDEKLKSSQEELKKLKKSYEDDSILGTAKRLAKYGTKSQVKQRISRVEGRIKVLQRRKENLDKKVEVLEDKLQKSEAVKKEIAKVKDVSSSTHLTNKAKTLDAEINNLIEQIAKGEGITDSAAKKHGYKSKYDVTLGYGAYDGGKHKPLSQMTLAEVDKLQTKILKNPKNRWNSSAVGLPQVTRTTLRGIIKEKGWSKDKVFDEETQKEIYKILLERRGLKKFISGKITADKFQDNLSKEWASIANPYTKKSYYGQHTGSKDKEMKEKLAGISNVVKEIHHKTKVINNKEVIRVADNKGVNSGKNEVKIAVDLTPKNKGNVV